MNDNDATKPATPPVVGGAPAGTANPAPMTGDAAKPVARAGMPAACNRAGHIGAGNFTRLEMHWLGIKLFSEGDQIFAGYQIFSVNVDDFTHGEIFKMIFVFEFHEPGSNRKFEKNDVAVMYNIIFALVTGLASVTRTLFAVAR